MSFFTSFQSHFSINETNAHNLVLETTSHLYALRASGSMIDNKVVVAFLRNFLEEKYQIKIPNQKMYEILSQIMGLKNYNVALSKEAEFKDIFLKDISKILEKVFTGGYQGTYVNDYICTGDKELDNDLGGGLQKRTITTVLGRTNVGKSMFCISIAANALRSNPDLKVLHISLEGDGSDAILRYATNLNEGIFRDTLFNIKESVKNKKLDRYKERLMVINRLGFNYNVKTLIEELKEIHKAYAFDLLVIDYPQILDAVGFDNYRDRIARVYRGLNDSARELNCAVLAPAQATRNMKDNKDDGILRIRDISEAFEIARISSCILSLNKNMEDEQNQTLRIYLEKNRISPRNKIFTIKTNYPGCNLIID